MKCSKMQADKLDQANFVCTFKKVVAFYFHFDLSRTKSKPPSGIKPIASQVQVEMFYH